MHNEHIQKEKEYGIPWRSAFKKELFEFADEIFKRSIGDQGLNPNDDPFQIYHKIIKKFAVDAATYD